mmetsp:Transcript_8993/g.19877  ORF Transcript_8993/g.19877 Transcript_8993/m.19877 type:complete len:205 (+) Transcript_8993:353-967(+)
MREDLLPSLSAPWAQRNAMVAKAWGLHPAGARRCVIQCRKLRSSARKSFSNSVLDALEPPSLGSRRTRCPRPTRAIEVASSCSLRRVGAGRAISSSSSDAMEADGDSAFRSARFRITRPGRPTTEGWSWSLVKPESEGTLAGSLALGTLVTASSSATAAIIVSKASPMSVSSWDVTEDRPLRPLTCENWPLPRRLCRLFFPPRR